MSWMWARPLPTHTYTHGCTLPLRTRTHARTHTHRQKQCSDECMWARPLAPSRAARRRRSEHARTHRRRQGSDDGNQREAGPGTLEIRRRFLFSKSNNADNNNRSRRNFLFFKSNNADNNNRSRTAPGALAAMRQAPAIIELNNIILYNYCYNNDNNNNKTKPAPGALAGHAPGGGGLEGRVLLRVEVEDGALVAHLRQHLQADSNVSAPASCTKIA